ncbi:MAG: hypothetical protein CVT86_03670 [Alphaproteobacteria bacterium HGW-Alphaproteobacteria-8]|nr:MAG: hypothetical protein CVT86_03670 [Alphaproteobacteria bacterium HGW-Alphaproteobacteria-8]
MELLSDPAAWASFLTLVVLEIVLGVDNVIFISIVANRLPPERRGAAMRIGLSGALVLRVLLLLSITWIVSLTAPFVTLFNFALSWRDLILLMGGLFLIYKAVSEIHAEVEGEEHAEKKIGGAASFGVVLAQIMVLDLVFSLDSVITAVGVADHVEVMIAAVVIAIVVMMVAAQPIARFVAQHPSTKMLALSFLVMIGMALMADGLHFHIDRGFIYAAMVFAGSVEALNLIRGRRRKTPTLAETQD